MTEERRYAGPAAFRRALTDRLKAKAADSEWSLAQLQRQLAYDRLLRRLYLLDDGWVVKGATALLARDLSRRATIDVDVYRDKAVRAAEADLRMAVAREIGDWFRFEVGPGRAISDGVGGVRLPLAAYVGATPWASFHVDLVGSDLRMTGEPDPVPPLARLGQTTLLAARDRADRCEHLWVRATAELMLALSSLRVGTADAAGRALVFLRSALAEFADQRNATDVLGTLYAVAHAMASVGQAHTAVQLRAAVVEHASRIGADPRRYVHIAGPELDARLDHALPEAARAAAEQDGRVLSWAAMMQFVPAAGDGR